MVYEELKIIYNFFKSIISVNTVMYFRLLGGLYYNTSSNRIVSVTAAVYCLAASSYITYTLIKLMIAEVNAILAIKFTFGLITYCSCVVVSLCTNSEHFQVYLNDMEAIDVLFGVRPDFDIPVTRVLFVADIIVQLAVDISYYVHMVPDGESISIIFFVVSFFLLLCGMTTFARIMMFELMWHRVRMFRQYLENTLPRVSRLQDAKEARDSIRQCMCIYKKILDTGNKSKIPVKTMLILTMFGIFPKIIATVYEIIADLKIEDEYASVARYHELSMDVFLPCVPALLAALTRGEVKRIKFLIGRQMLTCQDDRVREVLDDSLAFLEHRPCRYTVCRLFSLDVGMVVSLLNLYVTYSLATIQFGHFYN